jgi:hypothetical protein
MSVKIRSRISEFLVGFFDDLFQVALSINDLLAEAITCKVKITSRYN